MPLISHGGGRRYVIALSGKSLNNSHPTAALATKLGRRYIVSFPRLILLYLIVETSWRTMNRVHSSSIFLSFEIIERFIYLFTYFLSNNRLIVNTIVLETRKRMLWKQIGRLHLIISRITRSTDQRNNWN